MDQSKGPDDSRRRGRKRKADLPQEDKFVPTADPAKRGIVAGGGSLRRRDTLKSTSRYSPPPAATRTRSANRSFPSTSQSKYVIDADAADTTTTTAAAAIKAEAPAPTVNRRKSLGLRNVNNSVNSVEVEVTKADGEKVVVTLPDGSQKNVPVPSNKKTEDIEEEAAPSAKEAAADPEYKPASRSSTRKKSNSEPVANQNQASGSSSTTTASTSEAAVPIASETVKTPKVSNLTTVKLTNQISTPISVNKASNLIAATSSVNKSHVVTPLSKTNLPAILKPAMASTPLSTVAVKNPAARRPPTQQLTKYMDSLPEVADCMNSDGIDDKNMQKMPDKIMLIHSELPLHLAVFVDNSEKEYLFQQIISPVQSTRFICLLCKGIDVNFGTKEEKDILLHYQSLHELDVEIGHAKFSEETVFICLPKMVLSQLDGPSNSLALNSCCQYCEQRLNDIPDMKTHYRDEHSKEVVLMEQEQIMKMHHYFYCHKCKHDSPDFDSHHQHMKTVHELKTFRCKSCVLVTQDETRLRTHFKAKHMLHSSGQNYQCYYCHGLLIGVERLLKHIQQSHMVQTGADFSCIACLQTCGRGKELLNHAQGCTVAGIKPVQKDNKFLPITADTSTLLAEGEVECYFCSVRLESEEIYQLHLHHEHMKWVGDPSKGPAEGENLKMLTVDDVISEEDLQKAKIQTYVGHWCRMCDQMVKVYQLFYLHMVNYHRLEKEFQCVITQCKAQFTDFEEFKKHCEENGHSQKTIISHSDEVSVCTYCDIYFPTEDELINHLITDQHINKFTASGHFHRTEPRNFKCKACHTYFGMKESYIHHLETESHKYVCHYCGITTATPSARRAHIQNTHPEKLGACEECGELHSDIMAHFVHHGFSFECKKCVKKFYNRERLNAHMEVHQDPIECTWDTCGRMIATRSMLVTHYRGHKSEHKCNVCGQAFWNYSMLTSHLRSHQPLPRSVPQPQKLSNVNKSPMTYSNLQRVAANSSSTRQRIINTPNLTNNVIRCGHCSNLFKSTRELNAHNCKGKTATPASVVAVNNGGQQLQQQNKLYDLASKASTAPKAKPAPRKASPKKAAPTIEQQEAEMVLANVPAETPADEDTQLIMILNQVTGELMEITAPKGMEVKDVIESLNFQSMEEAVAVEQPMDEQNIIVQEEGVMQQDDQNIIVQQEEGVMHQNEQEQEETAVAIEMIAVDQPMEEQNIIVQQQEGEIHQDEEQSIIVQQEESVMNQEEQEENNTVAIEIIGDQQENNVDALAESQEMEMLYFYVDN